MHEPAHILVASESDAGFFEVQQRAGLQRPRTRLQAVGRLVDPSAHLHNRELASDRPGRRFDHAPLTKTRRGATPHHGTGEERRPRDHLTRLFAHRVAQRMLLAYEHGRPDHWVLVAPPHFLGLLRPVMKCRLRDQVVKVGEISPLARRHAEPRVTGQLNIRPTKSALLGLRRELVTLLQGHDLLERKRELLIRLVHQRLSQYRQIRREAGKPAARSRKLISDSRWRAQHYPLCRVAAVRRGAQFAVSGEGSMRGEPVS